MNLKLITFVAITSGYIIYTDGINSHNKFSILKCKSTPDLRSLYNDTSYNYNNKNIISCDEYKKHIYNKYKRNKYLRSKEKYTFGADTK